MATAYPGPQNVYVPSFDATGHLTISYSRNPKDFPLNEYITLTPITQMIGLYLRFNAQQAARIIKTNLGEFAWNDGAEAPTGNWALEAFTWVKYEAQRYAFPFTMGRLTMEQAQWPIVAQHAAFSSQQAMTARTLSVQNVLTTSANYVAANILDQVAADWTTGTTSNPVVKKALNRGAQLIQKGTLGVVKPKDLCTVWSPDLASAVASSAEIQDYVKNSPFALAQVRGDVPSQNGQWGLPDTLYNYKVVVEDTVRDSSIKEVATQNIDYMQGKRDCFMVSRPGALMGVEGTPSFGSIHVLMEEEMTVEIFDDALNRRILGRVVENYAVEAATNLAMVWFQNCQPA